MSQRELQAQQFMALLPVDAGHHLDPGAISAKPQVQSQLTGAHKKPLHHNHHQRTGLTQVRRAQWLQRQRVLAVISRQIPGIPELTLIAIATQLKRTRQLLNTVTALQRHQAIAADLAGQQSIAKSPASGDLVVHHQGVPIWRLRRF